MFARLASAVLAALVSVFPPPELAPGLGKANPCDVDKNGFVNGDDADTFGHWFEAGDIRADFDRNGFVNGEDFDAFTAAFQRGGFVASTYTINSATVSPTGGLLELVATGPTPAFWGPMDSYFPFLTGKRASLSSGQRLIFKGASPGDVAGTTTLTIRYKIDLNNRVPYTGPTSGITFSADAGFLTDKYGNTVGAAMNMTVLNLSLTNADGTPVAALFNATPSGWVRYYVNYKDGNDTTGTGSLASPFKTKRKAALQLAANGHLNDGSHIAVVTDGTSAYDEPITSNNGGMRFNISGPDAWHRASVYPVDATGVFRKDLRANTVITGVITGENRDAFYRDGGGEAEGVAIAKYQRAYGMKVTNANPLVNCPHRGFYYGYPAEDVLIEECQFSGIGLGIYAQDHSGLGKVKNFDFHRNVFDGIWSDTIHAIGVLTEGTAGRMAYCQNTYWKVGYHENTLTQGDILSRPLYLSDTYDGATSTSLSSEWSYGHPAEYAQQRTGGDRDECMTSHGAMDGYGGTHWGFDAQRCISSDLTDLNTWDAGIFPRAQGLYINSSDHHFPTPSRITNCIATNVKAGVTRSTNNRTFGTGGNMAGCTVQIDHCVGLNVGPIFCDQPGNAPSHTDLTQPRELILTDNINTLSGTPNWCLYVGMVGVNKLDYITGTRNCLINTAPSQFARSDNEGTNYTTAAFSAVAPNALVGLDNLIGPNHADTSRRVLSWLEIKSGQVGETACFALIKSRTPGTWPAWFDTEQAWRWIATGYVASNKVRSDTDPTEREGVYPGIIEFDYQTGPMPKMSDSRGRGGSLRRR